MKKGVIEFYLSCQRRLASSLASLIWMPAFAGMTNSGLRTDRSPRITRCFAVLAVFLFVGCVQNVHVKTTRRVSKVMIDDKELGAIGPEGRDVKVPIKFGAAAYELYDHDCLVGNGFVERSKINPWSFGVSVGGAMVLAPSLALSGALVANPAWIFSPSIFLQGGGVGAFWAYLAQTASFWTFPLVTLGGVIGLLPLLGLLRSERLPDVVLLTTHDSSRPW